MRSIKSFMSTKRVMSQMMNLRALKSIRTSWSLLGRWILTATVSQVGARTEELSKLNHQDAEFQRSFAECNKHLDQHVAIGSYRIVATRIRTYHPSALAVNHPYRPEEEARDSEKTYDQSEPIDSRSVCSHGMLFLYEEVSASSAISSRPSASSCMSVANPRVNSRPAAWKCCCGFRGNRLTGNSATLTPVRNILRIKS